MQLGQGTYQQRIRATMTSKTSALAVDIAGDKKMTNRLLASAGTARAPQRVGARRGRCGRGRHPDRVPRGDQAAGRQPRPRVSGSTCGPSARYVRGFKRAVSRKPGVVRSWWSRYVTGNDYRVLVIGGRMVAIAERVPAHVDRRRQAHDRRSWWTRPTRIRGGASVTRRSSPGSRSTTPRRDLVKKQGFALDDVPPKGEQVLLAATGNMSTGGISIDRTWDAHEDNVEIAEEAARVVGLDVAGIDFLAPDISEAVRETRWGDRRGQRGARVPDAHPPHRGRAAVRGQVTSSTGCSRRVRRAGSRSWR